MPVFCVGFEVYYVVEVVAESAEEAGQAARAIAADPDVFSLYDSRNTPTYVAVDDAVILSKHHHTPSYVISEGEWLPIDFTYGHRFHEGRCRDCSAEDACVTCSRAHPDVYPTCDEHTQTRCLVNYPEE